MCWRVQKLLHWNALPPGEHDSLETLIFDLGKIDFGEVRLAIAKYYQSEVEGSCQEKVARRCYLLVHGHSEVDVPAR